MRSAVHLDRPFRDGESEAGAAAITRAAFIDAEESIEDARRESGGDAGTLVDDVDRSLRPLEIDAKWTVDPSGCT